MSDLENPTSGPSGDTQSLASLGLRSALGGVLMGLANLVPGISGGTMLLATGVYPRFIDAIAEVTTLRFRLRSVLVLSCVAGSAFLAILLFAGLMKALVIDHRWIMYSLFIGLTLGGVPLVWRLARPASLGLVLGVVAGFILMLLLNSIQASGTGDHDITLLFLSGLAGASAMILPGVSGGYLLLLLGQYETILGAIDTLKQGLLGGAGLGIAMQSLTVVVPVGAGVLAGIVGVSNLIRWLLANFAKPTLGVLLGLLLGAVVGLWPFQEPVAPKVGEIVQGQVVTPLTVKSIDLEDWRVETFQPTAGDVASSLALIALGLGATLAISRIGRED